MATDISHTPPEYADPEKSLAQGEKLNIKTAHNLHGQDIELENGHLAELEVDMERVLDEEGEGDYDADTSPFPQVRAVVPETDDTAIPVNTFRAWFLGIVRNWRSIFMEELNANLPQRSLFSLAPA